MGTVYSTSIGGKWKEDVDDNDIRRLKNTKTKKTKGKSGGKSNTKSK
tara:strand:+ start:132 stop:272 length:141 start_codon:yes stop_codon:yes gene_type:complete